MTDTVDQREGAVSGSPATKEQSPHRGNGDDSSANPGIENGKDERTSSQDKNENDERTSSEDKNGNNDKSSSEDKNGNDEMTSSQDKNGYNVAEYKDEKSSFQDKETKARNYDGADVSDAFSRRDNSATPTVTSSSIYNAEVEKKPAWMRQKEQQEQDGNKYDQYGSRQRDDAGNGVSASSTLTSNDDRYSKYNGNGIKRSLPNDDDTNDARSRKLRDHHDRRGHRDRSHSHDRSGHHESTAPQPYSNLQAANPSSSYQTFQSNLRDRENRDINAIVRSHYNQRTYQSRLQGSRTKSPIYKLRNFNNAIKYILLGEFFRKDPAPENQSAPSTVLDLCCGKGGDLNKCEFVSVDQYVGIDISDASVKEAFSRYSQNKARFIPQNGQLNRGRDSRRYNFEACFATGDCFSHNIPEILEPNFPGIIQNLFPVDCVSIQFAMHYAFETEEKVKTLLTNVTKSLRPGGTFIGTIPSSDFIRDKIIRKDLIGDRKFGNDLYSVTFEKEPPKDGVFRPPFGNKYTYYLKDAIDDIPEYVVPFEYFRSLCEEFGLTLKYKKNFIDIFNQNIPKYFSKLNKNLIEGMKRSDGKYGAEGMEKEAVGFYIGFVFEKLGN